ncbi:MULTISPECIES: MBL fold metallo-hydrolase [unclassified Lysobacter]|uniref:MBL fold metallo-hydrolase n=1 Tax=unclassified Lysobacter TaxID=2635362 RepID=UPI001BEC310A|nr:MULTISPECIES: MBL fold metallo-hydrolase [unclassified Lysobacter]MBT2744952.1 MBL fold metallo-hydrolase [Lysobacter sp. ISL-42]MBT2752055.1 MBL fold metallo-hydrolase [Lysobacter sp. ISL-50]MBT2778552.1 MBL fold metallo-hydrolase [Lysobacter sp. ISL-54]MBT2780517.1 MBL fold metallo-hydrolase [Lysobacter sp. ISL-52]
MNLPIRRWLSSASLLIALLFAVALPAPALDLPQRWIHGAAGEPSLQVHQAAPGLWVLRQSKASNFEAPFMYLIAGDRRALLLDTGAEPAAGHELPLRATVDRLLAQWQREHGLASLPLVIAHSHGHRDHVHGDAQFRDRADTRIVGIEPEKVAAFFGLDRWPEGLAQFDLGHRALTVMPLPGHEPAHIAIYDADSATLLSGDSLYPGLLTVRDWQAYRASARRLAEFARTHRIDHVLGAHIEMSATPGQLYPLGSADQPDEHALSLSAKQLAQWQRTVEGLGDFVHEHGGEDFAFARIAPADEFADKPNTHGMLVVGVDAVYLSHLPMFHRPHNYQLIFEAALPDAALRTYRADAKAHPGEYYTLAPTAQWVLPDTIRPDGHFKADLYRGHFERGGTMIASGIDVGVRRIVHFRRFEPGRKPQPAQWIGFGRAGERFAAHRLEGPPDMDQIVQVSGARGAEASAEDQALVRTGNIATPSGELHKRDRIGGLRVRRIIYTEYGDVAE